MLKIKIIAFLFGILLFCETIQALNPTEIVYKQIDTTKLKLFVYKPEIITNPTGNIAIVFFLAEGGIKVLQNNLNHLPSIMRLKV